uniref:Bactericidal permeability-increasing protein n=1 Tax=Anser cygnoides TaxID=8845 RepID=A0A8B9DCT4_ANSCY
MPAAPTCTWSFTGDRGDAGRPAPITGTPPCPWEGGGGLGRLGGELRTPLCAPQLALQPPGAAAPENPAAAAEQAALRRAPEEHQQAGGLPEAHASVPPARPLRCHRPLLAGPPGDHGGARGRQPQGGASAGLGGGGKCLGWGAQTDPGVHLSVRPSAQGEFFGVDRRWQSPFSPRPVGLPEAREPMLLLAVTEFVANSAAFVYFTAGALRRNISGEALPRRFPLQLRTKSLGVFSPQLQEHFPDLPMELHLSARRQPLLSCRPDALHGTLFGSAEAFVVLPNATRVPAFLLDIVSAWPQGAELGCWGPYWGPAGRCWALPGDAGTAPASPTSPLAAGRQRDGEADHHGEQAGGHRAADEVRPPPAPRWVRAPLGPPREAAPVLHLRPFPSLGPFHLLSPHPAPGSHPCPPSWCSEPGQVLSWSRSAGLGLPALPGSACPCPGGVGRGHSPHPCARC